MRLIFDAEAFVALVDKHHPDSGCSPGARSRAARRCRRRRTGPGACRTLRGTARELQSTRCSDGRPSHLRYRQTSRREVGRILVAAGRGSDYIVDAHVVAVAARTVVCIDRDLDDMVALTGTAPTSPSSRLPVVPPTARRSRPDPAPPCGPMPRRSSTGHLQPHGFALATARRAGKPAALHVGVQAVTRQVEGDWSWRLPECGRRLSGRTEAFLGAHRARVGSRATIGLGDPHAADVAAPTDEWTHASSPSGRVARSRWRGVAAAAAGNRDRATDVEVPMRRAAQISGSRTGLTPIRSTPIGTFRRRSMTS